jgi:hypothetical protein
MISKRLAQSTALALLIGAGTVFSAAAQVDRPMQRNQAGQRDGAPPVITLNNWDYEGIYRNGWSVEQLMDDADVVGALGEDIGSVENVFIGERGRILGIVAQVGGFWDIGDTHVFVPWNQVTVSPTLNRVIVPITEENVDQYSTYADSVLRRADTRRTQVVDDDLATGPRIWKATDIIDDYAYVGDNVGYGYVNDLIFTTDGDLHAVVVNAGTAYGGGYRAFPFYGYGYGWNPGLPYYNTRYGENDIVDLRRFEYNRLGDRVTMRNQTTNVGTRARDDATATGAVPTQWTFRDIDRDRNLELTDREFSSVGRDIYGRWDSNRSGGLERNEFYGGLYNVFDADRDRRISRNEFDTAWGTWGRDWDQVGFDQFDAGRDGYLDRNELVGGLDRIGYYDGWDLNRDTALGESEFNTGLYDTWDADADGVLAQNEFGGFNETKWF